MTWPISPEAMAEIVDQVFPQYLARNDFTASLIEEGGVYKLKLTIRQGQLLINGKRGIPDPGGAGWLTYSPPGQTKTGARVPVKLSQKETIFKDDRPTPVGSGIGLALFFRGDTQPHVKSAIL